MKISLLATRNFIRKCVRSKISRKYNNIRYQIPKLEAKNKRKKKQAHDDEAAKCTLPSRPIFTYTRRGYTCVTQRLQGCCARRRSRNLHNPLAMHIYIHTRVRAYIYPILACIRLIRRAGSARGCLLLETQTDRTELHREALIGHTQTRHCPSYSATSRGITKDSCMHI